MLFRRQRPRRAAKASGPLDLYVRFTRPRGDSGDNLRPQRPHRRCSPCRVESLGSQGGRRDHSVHLDEESLIRGRAWPAHSRADQTRCLSEILLFWTFGLMFASRRFPLFIAIVHRELDRRFPAAAKGPEYSYCSSGGVSPISIELVLRGQKLAIRVQNICECNRASAICLF